MRMLVLASVALAPLAVVTTSALANDPGVRHAKSATAELSRAGLPSKPAFTQRSPQNLQNQAQPTNELPQTIGGSSYNWLAGGGG
jgi:hypothetical protein